MALTSLFHFKILFNLSKTILKKKELVNITKNIIKGGKE